MQVLKQSIISSCLVLFACSAVAKEKTNHVHFSNDTAPGEWMDVYNGGKWDKVTRMADSKGYSGQSWEMRAGKGGLHFSNSFNGKDYCLSVKETHKTGEHHLPVMTPCGSAPHQNWVFRPIQGGHGFVMRDFGKEECLTAVGPDKHLIMASCGSRSGQGWDLVDTDHPEKHKR